MSRSTFFFCSRCLLGKYFLWSHFLLCCFCKDDVNAVTFADESGNLLYSGSDDSLCKVSIVWMVFLFVILASLGLSVLSNRDLNRL